MELIFLLAVIYVWVSSIKKSAEKKKKAQTNRPSRQIKVETKRENTDSAYRESPSPYTMSSSEGMSHAYQPLHSRMQELVSHAEEQKYQGSLGGESHEGEDICDPALGHAIRPFQSDPFTEPLSAEQEYQWNGREILRGVIMSEILTPPSKRKWGRR